MLRLFRMIKKALFADAKNDTDIIETTECDSDKYSHNDRLSYIGGYDGQSYPLMFSNPSFHLGAYDLSDGELYHVQTIDNIEYVFIANNKQGVISAYDISGTIKRRVGAAGYHYIQGDRGLYLDSCFVCFEYRLKHICTNILTSLIYAEKEYLESHNIFVHACAEVSSENALNQTQLEHLYESKGYTLVSCEDEVFYRDITIKPEVRKCLLDIIHTDTHKEQ